MVRYLVSLVAIAIAFFLAYSVFTEIHAGISNTVKTYHEKINGR